MKWILLLAILSGCATRAITKSRPLIPSPLGGERARVRATIPLPIIPPPTPVYHASAVMIPKPVTLTLEWDYPVSMDGITGFKLYRGTNSGAYFAEYPLTLTNRATVTFTRQPGEVDYFVCVSTNLSGLESLPSNEAFWPPPYTYRPPTNVIVSWNAPAATVEGSSNLITWRVITNVTGSSITLPIQPGSYFYRVATDRQTQLSIEAQ